MSFRRLIYETAFYLGKTASMNKVVLAIGAPSLLFAGVQTFSFMLLHDSTAKRLYELKDADMTDHLMGLITEELRFYETDFSCDEEKFWELKGIKITKPYMFAVSNDMESHVLGCAKHKIGCSIVLPNYLNFENTSDVDENTYMAYRISRHFFRHFFERPKLLKIDDWSSDLTQKFINSLILSDDAKRYLIRRSIYQANTNAPCFSAMPYVIPGIAACTTYLCGHKLVEHLRFSKLARIPLLAFCVLAQPLLYRFMTDYLHYNYLFSMDSLSLGSEGIDNMDELRENEMKQRQKIYKRGAVEFFEKNVQRNRCMDKILRNQQGNDLSFADADGNAKNSFVKVTDRLKAVTLKVENQY